MLLCIRDCIRVGRSTIVTNDSAGSIAETGSAMTSACSLAGLAISREETELIAVRSLDPVVGLALTPGTDTSESLVTGSLDLRTFTSSDTDLMLEHMSRRSSCRQFKMVVIDDMSAACAMNLPTSRVTLARSKKSSDKNVAVQSTYQVTSGGAKNATIKRGEE